MQRVVSTFGVAESLNLQATSEGQANTGADLRLNGNGVMDTQYWILGANDSGAASWITAIAYLVVAILCSSNGKMATHAEHQTWASLRTFWYGVAGLMVFLGINKQLDLQTPFLSAARIMAQAEGWYSSRRLVQWVFLGCLAAAGMVLLTWASWRLKRNWRKYALVYLGITLLIAFVIIRGSPLQHISHILGFDVSGISGKRYMLELSGILCIGIGAVVARKKSLPAGSRRADIR